MKKIDQWQDEKDEYILNEGFVLKRADKLEFGIHETIYSNVDLELSFSWKKQTVDKIDFNNHFWIIKEGKRIGGVHIGRNYMGTFFMEVPYALDRFAVIRILNNAQLQWADKDSRIMKYGTAPQDIENFQKLGYRISHERRVMIRPTEVFRDICWRDNFYLRIPTISDARDVGKLFFESYSGGIDYETFGQRNLEEAVNDAERIIKIYESNNTLNGSTLIIDKNKNEMIGACIAGFNGFCDNNFSEIGDIVVKPGYRGLGLASNMIKLALTNLKEISPAVILCVTIGNPSEGLYHKMGFFPGVKFTTMYLDAKK
jgi:ribosomal protein S18 acetylase RimI-like enzyme